MNILRASLILNNLKEYIITETKLYSHMGQLNTVQVMEILKLQDACGALEASIAEAMSEINPMIYIRDNLKAQLDFINEGIDLANDQSIPAEEIRNKKKDILSKFNDVSEAILTMQIETDVKIDEKLLSVVLSYYK